MQERQIVVEGGGGSVIVKAAQACHEGVWSVKTPDRPLFSESDNALPRKSIHPYAVLF